MLRYYQWLLFLQITNGQFTWDQESSVPVLADINVEIPAGKSNTFIKYPLVK